MMTLGVPLLIDNFENYEIFHNFQRFNEVKSNFKIYNEKRRKMIYRKAENGTFSEVRRFSHFWVASTVPRE